MANDLGRQLSDIEIKVARVQNAIFDKRVTTRMAKLALQIVYKRTKSGKGIKGNSNPKLKPLSPSYKMQRSGKIAFRTIRGRVVPFHGVDDRPRTLGKYFKPEKSNLTYTGQLLESMIINAGRFTFGVQIPNTPRQRQKGNHSPPSNSEVAGFVEQNGRAFFALSKGEIRIILFEYEKIIRKIIRQKGL